MSKRNEGKTHISMYIQQLPKYLADALDIYGRHNQLRRREDAIIKSLKTHPEITKIVGQMRAAAGIAALNERRAKGLGGQI